jgi:hypothetical protein
MAKVGTGTFYDDFKNLPLLYIKFAAGTEAEARYCSGNTKMMQLLAAPAPAPNFHWLGVGHLECVK